MPMLYIIGAILAGIVLAFIAEALLEKLIKKIIRIKKDNEAKAANELSAAVTEFIQMLYKYSRCPVDIELIHSINKEALSSIAANARDANTIIHLREYFQKRFDDELTDDTKLWIILCER